jgi:hypothetical protein
LGRAKDLDRALNARLWDIVTMKIYTDE